MIKKILLLLGIILPGMLQGSLNWSPFLSAPSVNATSFQLAVNHNSEALLAWHEPSRRSIKTSFYDFIKKTWTPPDSLSTDGETISLLAMYFTHEGKGALIWLDSQNNSLYLSQLEPGQGWLSPFILPLPFPATDIRPLFDSQGNLSIVWSAWNGQRHTIQGVFFSESLHTWSPISDLSPIGLNCSEPKITMNSAGGGAVVWKAAFQAVSTEPTQTFVQAVMFNHSQFEWSGSYYFGYDWIGTSLSNPTVAIDSNRNIVILWENKRPENRETRVQYVRFLSKKNQWSFVSEMEAGTSQPKCENDSDNIQVYWTGCEGVNRGLNIARFDIENNLWFARHNLIQSAQGISKLKVKVDPLDKLNLMWLHATALQVAHYDKDWNPPIHLDKNMSCNDFDFASDGLGNLMLIVQNGQQLQYSIGNYLLPPDYFEGHKFEVRYPNRKVLHGHLFWSHAESPNVMGYVLRRDTEILAILPAHVQQFTDYRCPFNAPMHYDLTIVNVDNIESFPIKLKL